ncbi:ATP--guanido phosphotransferase [Spirochaetota bacterium]
MLKELLQLPRFWSTLGPNSDIVLSSRVRLARNIHSIPFTNKIKGSEAYRIKVLLDKYINGSDSSGDLIQIDLNEIDKSEKRFLRERNIITYEMEISDHSMVILNKNDDYIVMVNEEDHLRIQVIRPGLQFEEAYEVANNVDDDLNKFIPYSFSHEYGFLSPSPSNLGAGLKVSAMLHLPALTQRKRITTIIQNVRKIGADIMGTIQEGGQTLGSIYQISNKSSMGKTEIEIIEDITEVINKVIELEDNYRDEYISQSRVELEDKIWRSLGILKYSRQINYVEAMEHLSSIRLGIILAVIRGIDLSLINDLMVNIQWSHLQSNYDVIFTNNLQCDEYRADYLRNNLNI